MFDALNLPGRPNADLQQFTRPCTAHNTQWETWRKPRGVSMCQVITIGGGGGGGGGFSGASGTARGGGGGGGSSSMTVLTIASIWLPDVLYVQVGAGGIGGGPGLAGTDGMTSFVSISPLGN